jgi:hypothetical protein
VWRIGIGLRGLRDQQCAKGGGSECNSRVTVGAGRQCQFRSFVRGDYCSLLLSFLRGYRFQFRLTGSAFLSIFFLFSFIINYYTLPLHHSSIHQLTLIYMYQLKWKRILLLTRHHLLQNNCDPVVARILSGRSASPLGLDDGR